MIFILANLGLDECKDFFMIHHVPSDEREGDTKCLASSVPKVMGDKLLTVEWGLAHWLTGDGRMGKRRWRDKIHHVHVKVSTGGGITMG